MSASAAGEEPQEVSARTQPPEHEIGVWDLIGAVWRRKWLILVLSVLAGAAAYGVSYLMTPEYRASVVLSPASGTNERSRLAGLMGQIGGLGGLAGLGLPESERDEEAFATLKSRSFTESFIEEHGLMPILFPAAWDAETGTWQVEPGRVQPSIRDGFAVLDGSMRTLVRDRETGLVTLHMEWSDPVQAAEWANQMVDDVNERLRAQKVRESQKSIAYLESELEKTNIAEVRNGIYRLVEGHIQNIALANARDQFAFKIIDPAVPADPEDFRKPNRTLMAAAGLVAGGLLGILLSLALEFGPRFHGRR